MQKGVETLLLHVTMVHTLYDNSAFKERKWIELNLYKCKESKY